MFNNGLKRPSNVAGNVVEQNRTELVCVEKSTKSRTLSASRKRSSDTQQVTTKPDTSRDSGKKKIRCGETVCGEKSTKPPTPSASRKSSSETQQMSTKPNTSSGETKLITKPGTSMSSNEASIDFKIEEGRYTNKFVYTEINKKLDTMILRILSLEHSLKLLKSE